MTDFDVVVVGAGIGGIYAVHRFRDQGLSVLGLEAAPEVGGVWFHNRYPGARVDVESYDYCYYFSPEIYCEWTWTEKYAAQPEILAYLNFVADKLDIRKHFRFETALAGAQWVPDEARYHLRTSVGDTATCRFLVMATGNLSAARDPHFPGLADFSGEWVQASHWPDRHIELAGRRVGVIGTGSSGVQTISAIADQVGHLTVFQRSPNFSVPAHNGPIDTTLWAQIKQDVKGERAKLLASAGARHMELDPVPAASITPQEQQERLERAWSIGGHGFNRVFTDQSTNQAANDIVSEFVRNKIRSIVHDPGVAELLCPEDHPIGSRRLCVDTDYFATYNRDNVSLVDVRSAPIERITETGIRTADGKEHELDLIIFALGFHAFTGALDAAGIRNESGAAPSDAWAEAPCALLGLMTAGFPNLFILTGPGSPSVLASLTVHNEQNIDWVADCIAYLDATGYSTIVPSEEAQAAWARNVSDAAAPLLRYHVSNYMVHVSRDGGRHFIPYAGGFGTYVEHCDRVARNGYEGFLLK
ncbi:flavin-containing monooxygenase [Acrocarpospora pleiomorpha]|nr:NAD(P)/FAD-dependent oxidoreductase [Acrocarpospora pleiomorpha]